MAVSLCVVSYFAIGYVDYVDENGKNTTGIVAASALREEKNKWAGYITDDVLRKVLEENAGGQENRYSEQEQQFLIAQYEKLKKPFYYEYADRWVALLEYPPSIIIF